MIPLKFLSDVLGLNKKLDTSALSEDSGEVSVEDTGKLSVDATDLSHDLDKLGSDSYASEEDDVSEEDAKDTDSLIITKPIKGSGVKSFLSLTLESLKFWYEAIRSIKDSTPPDISEESGSEVREGEKSSVIQPLLSDGYYSDSLTEDKEESAVEESFEVSEESNNSGISPFWFVAGISLVGLYYGVKLVYKDGKPSLALVDEGRYNDLLSSVLQGKALESPSAPYATSDIVERLGLSGSRLSTEYGVRDALHLKGHYGIDLAIAEGTPIKSPVSGVVQYVGYNSPSVGNFVEIIGANGLGYRFLHMKDVGVKVGDSVTLGDVIGSVGSTGRSTGPHLHLETKAAIQDIPVGTSIHKLGVYVNPLFDSLYSDSGAMVAEGRVINPSAVSDPVPINVKYNSESLIGTKGYNYLSVSGRDSWEGKYSSIRTKAGVFPTFIAPSYGLRAGIINLLNYQLRYDVSDSGGVSVKVADIASNPTGYSYLHSGNGDDSDRWLSTVEKVSGFSRNDFVDMRNTESLSRLVRGIAAAEHSVYIPTEDVSKVIRHYNIIDTVMSNIQKQ